MPNEAYVSTVQRVIVCNALVLSDLVWFASFDIFIWFGSQTLIFFIWFDSQALHDISIRFDWQTLIFQSGLVGKHCYFYLVWFARNAISIWFGSQALIFPSGLIGKHCYFYLVWLANIAISIWFGWQTLIFLSGLVRKH